MLTPETQLRKHFPTIHTPLPRRDDGISRGHRPKRLPHHGPPHPARARPRAPRTPGLEHHNPLDRLPETHHRLPSLQQAALQHRHLPARHQLRSRPLGDVHNPGIQSRHDGRAVGVLSQAPPLTGPDPRSRGLRMEASGPCAAADVGARFGGSAG